MLYHVAHFLHDIELPGICHGQDPAFEIVNAKCVVESTSFGVIKRHNNVSYLRQELTLAILSVLNVIISRELDLFEYS